MDQGAWADLVALTTRQGASVVAAGVDRDWSVLAEGLEWSCRETLQHNASCLVGYAGQLTAPQSDRWVPFLTVLEDEPDAAGMADVLLACGGILAAVVRGAEPNVISFHPYGMAGPRDSAAMGVVETLVHVDDVARTLGLTWEPADAACTAVLTHLFPDVVVHSPPWEALQWACGRIALPGQPRRDRWRWTNTGS